VVNWRKMYADARALVKRLGVTLDVTRAASGLTLAEQQTVEIARAISLNVKVLIMDEPTASLSAHEVRQLMQVARTLRDQGVAILYISHRLEEVFVLADRVTVLRDGRLISSNPTANVTSESLIRDMVGRDLEEFFGHTKTHQLGEVLLSVRGLGREGAFMDVGFDVRRGEVLCFAGLIGARRTDVGLALFGVAPADAGEISFAGKAVTIPTPRAAMQLGIAYVSEDRRRLGLALPMSIVPNISLPMLDRYLTRLGLIRRRPERAMADGFRKRLNIRTPGLDLEVGKLSGGNQQKVMLSKWLNADPKLLIVDEPTRGIDVGAKAEVHQIIRDLAAAGVAVIVISSDLPEVMALADRILVMREGRQMGIFASGAATQEKVMALATGQADRMEAA
jgi:rhamnose transport system ATP-binding protein